MLIDAGFYIKERGLTTRESFDVTHIACGWHNELLQVCSICTWCSVLRRMRWMCYCCGTMPLPSFLRLLRSEDIITHAKGPEIPHTTYQVCKNLISILVNTDIRKLTAVHLIRFCHVPWTNIQVSWCAIVCTYLFRRNHQNIYIYFEVYITGILYT